MPTQIGIDGYGMDDLSASLVSQVLGVLSNMIIEQRTVTIMARSGPLHQAVRPKAYG
jgi:hypothetical protein